MLRGQVASSPHSLDELAISPLQLCKSTCCTPPHSTWARSRRGRNPRSTRNPSCGGFPGVRGLKPPPCLAKGRGGHPALSNPPPILLPLALPIVCALNGLPTTSIAYDDRHTLRRAASAEHHNEEQRATRLEDMPNFGQQWFGTSRNLGSLPMPGFFRAPLQAHPSTPPSPLTFLLRPREGTPRLRNKVVVRTRQPRQPEHSRDRSVRVGHGRLEDGEGHCRAGCLGLVDAAEELGGGRC